MKKIRTFDLKFEGDNIDILNLKWSHYSMIMTCLTERIQKLKKPIGDSCLDDHRKKMSKSMRTFMIDCWTLIYQQEEAVSLDNQVLDALGK